MITGLETITSGKIFIGDKLVNNLSPQERNVAMAFETYALYPPLTVYENIAFPLQVMKLSKTEIKKQSHPGRGKLIDHRYPGYDAGWPGRWPDAACFLGARIGSQSNRVFDG